MSNLSLATTILGALERGIEVEFRQGVGGLGALTVRAYVDLDRFDEPRLLTNVVRISPRELRARTGGAPTSLAQTLTLAVRDLDREIARTNGTIRTPGDER